MRGGASKLLALPSLRPAPEMRSAHPGAAAAATAASAATAVTFVSHGASDVRAETFEEDWQRPPGDIAYLHDLLQSVDVPQHPTGQRSGAAKSVVASQREGEKAEEGDVAALQMRERQIGVIERRRRRARCRCDAVDAAFARSVERRMQAMQHLAMDPPAERLVGQGMTQYVPAALLPEDVLDGDGHLRPGPLPLLPHSVVETHLQQQQQLGAGPSGTGPRASTSLTVAAITDGHAQRPGEQDALVFLTQLDAGQAAGSDRHASRGDGRRGSPPQRAAVAAEASSSGNAHASSHLSTPSSLSHDARRVLKEEVDDEYEEEEEEDWMRPSTLTASNKDRWRELGYHVVVVGDAAHSSGAGERELARRGFQATGAPPDASAGPTGISTRRNGTQRQPPPLPTFTTAKRTAEESGGHAHGTAQGTASPWRRAPLAPLPPVCLIQRRLPEEDMSATELRSRQSSAKRAARRRPGAGGEDGAVWKTGCK